jgi:beta-lactamase superfamily II metal-dependent hydrolase
VVGWLLVVAGTGAGPEDRSLDIYFIDVLGGAATLVVTPERESVLIDSGWPGQEDRDPKRIEYVLTKVAGLDHLDHLVTTHWHTDHYGGVEGLARRVPIRRFWDRGLPAETPTDADRADYPDGPKPDDPLGRAYRRASEGKRSGLSAGEVLPLRGAVEFRVLASGGRVIDTPGAPANPACADSPPDQQPDPSDNARSLALRLRFGKFDFLDCGDLTWNVEKKLVCPADQLGPIDLYQVTHHGMAISNHPTLLQTIRPTVAVMNNGPRKGGDPVTVRRLKGVPSIQAIYQLHKNVASKDAEEPEPSLLANASLEGGQFVHVSVAADGLRYTVRIGTEGEARSFESK